VIFSGTTVSFINKTDCHDITEILLKVVLKHYKPNLNDDVIGESMENYVLVIEIYHQLLH